MPSGKLPDIFIPISETAELLGCGVQSIETGLRNGSFPIGWAWYTGEADKPGKWSYRIPRQALCTAIERGILWGDDTPRKYTECRLYKIWSDMKQRCNNPNNNKYHLYGGRGIGYVSEWELFPEFEQWAYENGYREYLTLDRRNNSLGYMPENCRWSKYKEQTNLRFNHQFTIGEETLTIQQWADRGVFQDRRQEIEYLDLHQSAEQMKNLHHEEGIQYENQVKKDGKVVTKYYGKEKDDRSAHLAK